MYSIDALADETQLLGERARVVDGDLEPLAVLPGLEVQREKL